MTDKESISVGQDGIKMTARKKDRLVWNKDHTACVKIHKIREIAIEPSPPIPRAGYGVVASYAVKGFYNHHEWFNFGSFNSKADAQAFVDAINEPKPTPEPITRDEREALLLIDSGRVRQALSNAFNNDVVEILMDYLHAAYHVRTKGVA